MLIHLHFGLEYHAETLLTAPFWHEPAWGAHAVLPSVILAIQGVFATVGARQTHGFGLAGRALR